MKTLFLLSLAAVALIAAPPAAQAADLTGDWTFEVSTSQGSGTPSFVFKQDGEKLTGTYKGLLGEGDVTGTVQDKKLHFSFTGKVQGSDFTVTYDGEIQSDDTLKGTVDLGGMANGTFTGKRKK
jgi:polyisoprenoid-binding protein YceI